MKFGKVESKILKFMNTYAHVHVHTCTRMNVHVHKCMYMSQVCKGFQQSSKSERKYPENPRFGYFDNVKEKKNLDCRA